MKPKTMRRLYLREAVITLVIARLAVRFLPSARIFGWVDRPPRRVRRFANDEVAWVAWALEYSVTLPGMKTLCLPRALAAHAMLRRRGVASQVCLGVARNDNDIIAHAWIEVGGRKLIGGEDASRFTPLAAFGGVK